MAQPQNALRPKRARTAQSVLILLFSVLFSAVMLVHVVVIAASNHPAVLLCAVPFSACLPLVLGGLGRAANRLSGRAFGILLGVLLSIFFAASFITGDAMKFDLPTDTDIVYRAAASLLEHGSLDLPYPRMETFYPGLGLVTYVDYFCRYPNNIMLLVVLTGVYALARPFGVQPGTHEGQTLAVGLSALFISLTVLFLCLVVRQWCKSNGAVLLALGLSVACAPFYYSIPNFYTDVLVLCPLAAGLYCFSLGVQKKKLWPLGLSGLLLSIAVQMKVTAAVAVIALGIFALLSLRRGSVRRWLAQAGIFLGVFLLFWLAFTLWYRLCPWFDFSNEAALSLPFQLWMAFGSHGNGTYALGDMEMATAISNPAERSRALWDLIFQRYGSYSPGELLSLLYRKLVLTWNNGHFEGSAYTKWPLQTNWTVFFTQTDQIGYIISYWYGQVYLLAMYLFTLGSTVLAAVRRRLDGMFLCNLILFGIMLYLQVFETSPRRALIAAPFLIANTVFMAHWLWQQRGAVRLWLQNRKNRA